MRQTAVVGSQKWQAGKWYRGVLEAAERFMAKWHENEATFSRNRHASTAGGAQGNRKGG